MQFLSSKNSAVLASSHRIQLYTYSMDLRWLRVGSFLSNSSKNLLRCRRCLRTTAMAAIAQPDHKSAVAFVAQRSSTATLQELRCFKDKNFVRWPPHINLLYPFLPDSKESFAEAAQLAASRLRERAPFQVLLSPEPAGLTRDHHAKHTAYSF